MSDPLIICMFLLIVFAPCVIAFLGLADNLRPERANSQVSADEELDPPYPAPLQWIQPEKELSDGFEIRSFRKGIREHRIVVRDEAGGVKLHICEVRAAAAELMKLGGGMAVRDLMLIAAAGAVAMAFARESAEVVAREVAQAAREAFERYRWRDLVRREIILPPTVAESPPTVGESDAMPVPWQEDSAAA